MTGVGLSRQVDDRELSREEVWVPPGVGPSEWVRSNAYLDYRILKNAGPWAVAYVAGIGLGWVLSISGQSVAAMVVFLGAQLLFFVICGIAFTNIRRRNRLAIEAQRDSEHHHHDRHHHEHDG